MDKPSFAERIAALKHIATQLRTFAETIMLEAVHMEGVQTRFQHPVGRRASLRNAAPKH
jgi:hypothetical protein